MDLLARLRRRRLSPEVLAHLREELDRPDPWRLETSAYEQRRYSALLRLMGDTVRFDAGLEVGCAAGAFSIRMVERCARLGIIDVLPEALRRTRDRLGPRSNVTYHPAQVSDLRYWPETYDLIVIAEVLYYLERRAAIERAAANLARLLRPGGRLVFGSAVDAVSARWGLPLGAETAMAEWSRWLDEEAREECRGETPDQHSLMVCYRSRSQ